MWIQRTQSELGQEQTQSAMDAPQASAQKAADDQAWEEKKLRQEKRWLARQAHYFRTGRWDWHKHWQNYRAH